VPEKPKWPKLDPKTIAPLRNDVPDLYNFMPTRFITKDEAQGRGWTFFYIGESCRWGHMAPRYVSNPRLCVDCNRIKEGRNTVGAKGTQEYAGTKRPYQRRTSEPATKTPGAPTTEPRPLEPDAVEKKFITEYAATKSFKDAAERCGRTEAEFLGRLSYDKVFRAAVNQLEMDNGLSRTASMTEDFDWDDDKRVVLMRMYINTGDLAQAMRAIGVSNFHYEREMEENAEFRDDMERAEALAWRHVDRHAISEAMRGDSRLLQRVMAGNIEKYNERLKVDMNVTQKLTDDQINEQFQQAVARLADLGQPIQLPRAAVEAEFSIIKSRAEAEDAGTAADEDPADRTQSNMDLV
jgi:hypothetical protein